ncbi:hypothetical protein BC628DRAFT_1396506 [Trametes gibbosa]|nr:hypothetical protein BC628DRAFT_1396506 [Trametes gibbosa]
MFSPGNIRSRGYIDRPKTSKLASIFAKTSLQNDFTIEAAFANLEHFMQTSGVEIEVLVAEMEQVPFLLDFVCSGAGDDVYNTLQGALLDAFPTTPELFFSSIHAALLARLSTSLLLPYARVVDAPPDLVAHQGSVGNAIPLMEACSHFQSLHSLPEGADVQSDPKRLAKRKAQSRRRSSAASVLSPIIDRSLFLKCGITPPALAAEAADLMDAILREQRTILEFYLRVFRREPHQSYFRNAYLLPAPNERNFSDGEAPSSVPEPAPCNDAARTPSRPPIDRIAISRRHQKLWGMAHFHFDPSSAQPPQGAKGGCEEVQDHCQENPRAFTWSFFR